MASQIPCLTTLRALGAALLLCSGCSTVQPLEDSEWLPFMEVGPATQALPEAVTLEPPLDDIETVAYLDDFEAGPDVGSLPDAVTLDTPDCALVDPVVDLDLGHDLFTHTPVDEPIFASDQPVRLPIGVGVGTRWATCRDSGARCVLDNVRTVTTPVEARRDLFVTSFERCSGCPDDCELEAAGAWAAEYAFETDALVQGTYQVIVDTDETLIVGFIVDDEAARIVQGWDEGCRDEGVCAPRPISVVSTRRHITVAQSEAVTLSLQLEVPFRCPSRGHVTELGWDLSGTQITPVVYAVEPEGEACAHRRGGRFAVERTLTIAAGLLPPGGYTIEHGGEVITLLTIR